MNNSCGNVMTEYTIKAILRAAKAEIASELERFDTLQDCISNEFDGIDDPKFEFNILLDSLESSIQLLQMAKPYLFQEKKIKKSRSETEDTTSHHLTTA